MEEDGFVDICVTTASQENFHIRASLMWNVGRLKQVVGAHLRVNEETHCVRLLHGGRLLPEAELLGRVLTQSFGGKATVHAAVSEKRNEVAIVVDHNVPCNNNSMAGFERLRDAGLTEQEVAELRAEFALVHGGRVSREEEERWLDGEADRARNVNVGSTDSEWTHEALFAGLLVGFAFPPFLLFGSDLNKHGKAGLLIGSALNIISWTVYSFFT